MGIATLFCLATLCHTDSSPSAVIATSKRTDHLRTGAFWSAFGSASAAVASIAASQSLLGLSLFCLILLHERPRLPRFAWPLGLFVLGTLLSLAFSPDPVAGIPQIRKMYVLLGLVAVCSTFRGLRDSRRLVGAWCVLGGASAVLGIGQFVWKWWTARSAGEDFYAAYVASRITGFMSHWMTFSGQMMIVFLLGAALLLWGGLPRRRRILLGLLLVLVALAILLAMTRGIWIATACASVYLLWVWKRWAVALVPVVAVIAFATGPESLRTRLQSLVKPRGEMDSNMHRVVTWRTGARMIQAHPWLGLGPEMVGRQFNAYVPPDVSFPLPEGFYGHLHNIYLQYAAERGIPTLLALLLMFVLMLRNWAADLQAIPGAPPNGPPGGARWLIHGGIAVVIGVLITGLFEHNLGDSEILMMTLAAIGAVERGTHGTDTA